MKLTSEDLRVLLDFFELLAAIDKRLDGRV